VDGLKIICQKLIPLTELLNTFHMISNWSVIFYHEPVCFVNRYIGIMGCVEQ
jgi:hypothetical protein